MNLAAALLSPVIVTVVLFLWSSVGMRLLWRWIPYIPFPYFSQIRFAVFTAAAEWGVLFLSSKKTPESRPVVPAGQPARRFCCVSGCRNRFLGRAARPAEMVSAETAEAQ